MLKVDRAQIALNVMSGLNKTEASLLQELEALGRLVSAAKEEIAAMRVENVDATHLPAATDELDEVVKSTANAANEILDVCETLENLQANVSPEAADTIAVCVTRIYEACAFQDITGQRIGKVVEALRNFELRLARFASAVRARDEGGIDPAEAERRERAERLILNGPQPNGPAVAQDDIDALFA